MGIYTVNFSCCPKDLDFMLDVWLKKDEESIFDG